MMFEPEMEPVKIFSTRTVNFKITLIGRPVDRFLRKVFCLLFNASNEKFSKREAMGEVLEFETADGGLRKKKKDNFCIFCKIKSILEPF